MHKGTRGRNILLIGITVGLLLASCNLYPKFEGWELVFQIQADWPQQSPQGRLIAPDARKVTVEVLQGGILVATGSAWLPAPQTGITTKIPVTVQGMVAGVYEVRAYALNSSGSRIMFASSVIDFKPQAQNMEVNLRLVPFEGTPGVVTSLDVGVPSGLVNLTRKTTSFLKIQVPVELRLWTDAGTSFTLNFQKSGGEALSSLMVNGSTVSPGNPAAPGTYFVHYYFDGLADLSGYSYYVDTYDKSDRPVDRRPLLNAVEQAKNLINLAKTEIGTAEGQFPMDKTIYQADLDATQAAVDAAATYLPPNYAVESVDLLGPAAAAVNTAREKLALRKNGGATLLPPGAPASPLAPLMAAHDGTFLRLHWTDNSTLEQGYEVYRRLASETSYPSVPLATLPADTLTWAEEADAAGASKTGLVRDTTYFYKVKAVSATFQDPSGYEIGPVTTTPKAVIYTGPDEPAAWGSVVDMTTQHTEKFQVGVTTPWENSLAFVNEGFWPLTLEEVTIGGDNPGDYTFTSPERFYDLDWNTMDTGPARAVQTLPQRVSAGDVMFIKVKWNPSAPGIRKTSFTLKTDDSLLLPTGTGDNSITYQGEAVSINDYVGRWDVDPSQGVGNFTGNYPQIFRGNMVATPNSSLEIGGNVSTVADRFTIGTAMDMASYNMGGGNGTDYMQVQGGNPFDLDSGGTITMWTGMYFPKAGEAWTLLNTMNQSTSPTAGFALELEADSNRNLNWRLRVAGQTDFTKPYAGDLDTRWNLLAFSYDAGTTNFTLRVNQTEVFQAVKTMIHTAGDPIGWGSRPSDPPINHINHWKGSLDDLRIYPRILSAAEVDLLFLEKSTFSGNSWGKDIVAPPAPAAASVNRLVTDGTGHRAYFLWDLTNQVPGDPFMVQVEMKPTSPSGPPWVVRMGTGDLTRPWEEKVFSDPLFQPPVGTVLDYTFRAMDREGNLSAPVTQTGLTVRATGDPLGGSFSLVNSVLSIGSYSFVAIADSDQLFNTEGTHTDEAFTGSGDFLHGALGVNALDKSEFTGMGKTYMTVFLRVNPTGRIAAVEWLMDGGTPVANTPMDWFINPAQTPGEDVVYTPEGWIDPITMSNGPHTLTLRITTTDGLIYSGYASFEVKD